MSATIVGPQEYVGVTFIDLGTIDVKPLFQITALDTLPATMYETFANKKQLDVSINGYPRPGQVVAVLATVDCGQGGAGVSVQPPVIEWVSNYDSASEVLKKSFTVVGTRPSTCKILVNWLVRANKIPATNFDTSVQKNLKQVLVRPIITFSLTSPTAVSEDNTTKPLAGTPFDGPLAPIPPLSLAHGPGFTIFNSPINGRPITVSLSDIPVDATREAEIKVTVDCDPIPALGEPVLCDRDIFEWSPKTIRFGAGQNKGEKSAAVEVYGRPGTSGNATLYFELVQSKSTSEYMGGQVLKVIAVVRPLLTFNVIGLRRKFAMGIDNKITFQVQPQEMCTLVTLVTMTCPEITSSPSQLVWGASRDAQSIELASPAAVTDKDTCRVTVRTSGGALSEKAFVREVVNEPVQAIERPTLVFWERTIKYSDIKVGATLALQLTGNGDFNFREPKFQKTDPTSIENSSVAVVSTAAESKVLSEIQYGKNFIEFRTGESGSQLLILLGPASKFALARAETLTFQVRRTALRSNEALTRKKDFVKLTITGQAEEFAAAAQVIESGVSGGAAAMAAASLHTSLFVGRIIGSMDLLYCPDKGWKSKQDNMQWFHQLLPISFGDNESLGTYAAVGPTAVLVIIIMVGIHMTITYGVFLWRQRGTAWDKSMGAAFAFTWFPSADFFPALFYYQFVVSASLLTITQSPSVALRFVAAIGFLVLGFGAPLAILMRVKPGFHAKWYTSEKQFMIDIKRLEEEDKEKTGGNTIGAGVARPLLALPEVEKNSADDNNMSPRSGGVDDDDEVAAAAAAAIKAAEEAEQEGEEDANKPAGIMRLFSASGFWRNPADIYWVRRYGLLFDAYSEKYKTWLVAEVIFSFILGVLDGIAPEESAFCQAKASVMITFYFFAMIALVIARPFRRPWLNIVISFSYFLQFLTVALFADSVYQNRPAGNPTGATIFGFTVLMFHAVILIFVAVLIVVIALSELCGVEKLFQLRKTGRVDDAKKSNNNVQTEEEMKDQLGRDDFTKLMSEHNKQQAIEHRVDEKKKEFEDRTKQQVRDVVHADKGADVFTQKPKAQAAAQQEWNEEDMDFI